MSRLGPLLVLLMPFFFGGGILIGWRWGVLQQEAVRQGQLEQSERDKAAREYAQAEEIGRQAAAAGRDRRADPSAIRAAAKAHLRDAEEHARAADEYARRRRRIERRWW